MNGAGLPLLCCSPLVGCSLLAPFLLLPLPAVYRFLFPQDPRLMTLAANSLSCAVGWHLQLFK